MVNHQTLSKPPSPSSSSSSTSRFLDNLKQPDPDPLPQTDNNPFELHESDVVWSSSSSTTTTPPPSPPQPHLLRHHPHPHHRKSRFNPSITGLSAAISDDALHPSRSSTKPIPQLKSQPAHPKFHQSAPIDVPVWTNKMGRSKKSFDEFDEVDDEFDGEEEMVPPHVMVARSHVTFSVFEGVGRTLKGRDLRSARNAVFQKTGFID